MNVAVFPVEAYVGGNATLNGSTVTVEASRPASSGQSQYGATAVSGATGPQQPTWPTQIGQTVVDGGVTWQCFGVDGSASAYVQLGSKSATGIAYAQATPGQVVPVAANLALRILATGFCGSATVEASSDGGLTFGAAVTIPQMVNGGNPGTWAAGAAYLLGAQRYPLTKNGYWFQVTVAGTSGASEPPWNATIGATTTDGGVTWECMGYGTGQLSVGTGGGIQTGTGGPNLDAKVTIYFNDGPGQADDLGVSGAFFGGDVFDFDTDWTSQLGQDGESATALAARCRAQWATLAMGAPVAAIEAWAAAASQEVQVADAQPDPSGAGIVNLYVAGSDGPVSGGALAAVGAYVRARLPPGVQLGANGTATGLPSTVTGDTIALTASVYVAAAQLGDAQGALAAALDAYGLDVGIGGTVRYSQVIAVLSALPGVQYLETLELEDVTRGGSPAASDVALAAGTVAAFTTGGLTWAAA